MDPEERKKQILSVAKTLFSQKGYYQTQISDIQKEAGVARGTIYLYFKSKDNIFENILEEFQLQWSLVLKQHAPGEKGDLDIFRFRIKKTLEFFAKNPDYCNILLRIGLGLGENLDPIIRDFNRKMLELIRNYILEAVDAGMFRENIDIDLTSNLLSGAFMRMAYQYTIMEKNDLRNLNIENLTERYVNTFAYGIFNK